MSVLGGWPNPVALIKMSKAENVSARMVELEDRSMAWRQMLGVERCWYFWGERTPSVMWVLGSREIWVRNAVPSSPAPRRRMEVCL